MRTVPSVTCSANCLWDWSLYYMHCLSKKIAGFCLSSNNTCKICYVSHHCSWNSWLMKYLMFVWCTQYICFCLILVIYQLIGVKSERYFLITNYFFFFYDSQSYNKSWILVSNQVLFYHPPHSRLIVKRSIVKRFDKFVIYYNSKKSDSWLTFYTLRTTTVRINHENK